MALCFTMFWSDYSSWLGRGRGEGGRKARMALCFTMFWSDYSSWLGRGRGEGREESTHGSLLHHVLE